MKKLLVIASLLLSTYAQADLFENLTSNLNLNAAQSGNLRNGLASLLGGSSRSEVKVKESLSFNTCFDMLNKAKLNQLKEKKDFIDVGYALNNFYSGVIEGDYVQFHDNTKVSKFGRTLMRGLTDINSINFNSTASEKTAPHLDFACSNFMDIDSVTKVIVEDKECRKVDLSLNAIDAHTKKKFKVTASNFFCEGEHVVKTDFTGKRFDIIYKMHEIKE